MHKRTAYTIKALLSGDDSITDALGPPLRQSARDMGVNLDLRFALSEKQMADDIRKAAEKPSGVDALIVIIPSEEVASAVRYAAQEGMPVFGMNMGYEFATGSEGLVEDKAMQFFTGMNGALGGEMAADYFLQEITDYKHALFVSPSSQEAAGSIYAQRFRGYRDRLTEDSNNTIEVEPFEVSTRVRESATERVREKLSRCKYQSVLVGSDRLFPSVAKAIEENDCKQVKIGVFDLGGKQAKKHAKGMKLDFVIDQLHHLQGWATVQFAALYATTGLVVAPPQSGVYSSGPVLLNSTELLDRKPKIDICEGDTNRTDDSSLECECADRKNITIGGVVHGQQQNKFWDEVSSGANQSAIDMGVKLVLDRIEPQESSDILYEKMAEQILSLCDSNIDGLFVSLPDDSIVDAIRLCQEMNPNLQIISINAGYEESKKLELIHHIGMVEEDAGYQAGKEMERNATFNKAFCLNQEPWVNVLNDRCKGFKRAMNEASIEYLGQIEVDITQFKSAVEMALDESGAWDDYGMLLTDLAQLPAALELKKLHSNFVMGSFDTNSLLYESLEEGNIIFGIDQQPYLQGYLPVSILAHAATTKQYFLDHLVKPGPRFVIAPLTKEGEEEAICKEQNFPVCVTEGKSSPVCKNRLTARPSSSTHPSASPMAHPSSSMQPSNLPSFDRRPTLEILQSRGHVRCGLRPSAIVSGEGTRVELCRAIAAVIFGNPDSFAGVPVTVATRFQQLNDREVDLLLRSETHTIEREIRERTTKAGFTFSSPFYYDGMAYFGNKTLVECAEERKRYEYCSSLKICVLEGSTGYDFVQSSFPPSFFMVGSSSDEIVEALWKNECNVIANDRSYLLNVASTKENRDRQFFVGNKMMTKEPLAIVTRNSDREFSDVVNWVVQALVYGEEQGLTKDSSLCQSYPVLTSHASELNFLNAVHCVGNYAEVFAENSTRGINQINNGTTGMLYAVPFGDLGNTAHGTGNTDTTIGAVLSSLIKKGSLNCGVVVPDDFDGEIEGGDKIVGMSVEYCRTLAAALFNGNPNLVNMARFSGNESSIAALKTGTIDVLAGARVNKEHDLPYSPSGQGIHFSSPYYYGNETGGDNVGIFSLATHEDDPVFSSFVNCVVLATVYAQENIDKKNSEAMPLVPIFESELSWALRDAVFYSGSYDEIYSNNFGEGDRRRNKVNNIGGLQLLSFPGLSP